ELRLVALPHCRQFLSSYSATIVAKRRGHDGSALSATKGRRKATEKASEKRERGV
ncbi:unnamed protein product, partial [Citrullus colocynthis]